MAAKGRHLCLLTLNGETRSLAEWARVSGVPYRRLKSRIRIGWTLEEAISCVGKSTTKCPRPSGGRVEPKADRDSYEAYVGRTVGKLSIKAYIPEDKAAGIRRSFVCDCTCGRKDCVLSAHHIVYKATDTTGCGCGLVERARAYGKSKRTHGLGGTTEHRSWSGMIQRCTNPNSKGYPGYGARGITVSPEWDASFETFLADMGPKPSPLHSLERKDTDGPYSKDNCVWATPDVQGNNKRNNIYLTAAGRRQTVAQWSRELGIKYTRLLRHAHEGWSLEKSCERVGVPPPQATPPVPAQ